MTTTYQLGDSKWHSQNTMHERERNQTTDTSTLSNNSQQRQQLTAWVVQNGIHRTRWMRGKEIKQQTHQHWVTTDNNDNNLPPGWFKMAFTEHDAREGEKSNNRHVNTEQQQTTMTTTHRLGDSIWQSQKMMNERERNQTTDTSTLSNNSQQWQQLTNWVIQNGIHRTQCMRGREIKQQTRQHWVTTVNNNNNLPHGWFKMAFTEHDEWEGEKSNNRHINTE